MHIFFNHSMLGVYFLIKNDFSYFQRNQTMNLKPEHNGSFALGGVETEPQSTSFEISRNAAEVSIQQCNQFLFSLPDINH